MLPLQPFLYQSELAQANLLAESSGDEYCKRCKKFIVEVMFPRAQGMTLFQAPEKVHLWEPFWFKQCKITKDWRIEPPGINTKMMISIRRDITMLFSNLTADEIVCLAVAIHIAIVALNMTNGKYTYEHLLEKKLIKTDMFDTFTLDTTSIPDLDIVSS